MDYRLDSIILNRHEIKQDDALQIIFDAGLRGYVESRTVTCDEAFHMAREDARIKISFDATRADEFETLFSARELTQIKQRSFDVLYPQFKADFLVPVDTEGDTGADNLGYDQFDAHGVAGIINDEATDYKQAEISKVQQIAPVITIGAYIEYDLQDLRRYSLGQRSQLSSSNASLTQKKMEAAIKAIRLKEESLVAVGDSKSGLLGFYNNTNVPSVTLASDGTGSSDAWQNKSAKQVLRDLNKLVNTVIEQSKEIFVPNTLVLPIPLYTHIASTPFEGNNGTASVTILDFFINKSHRDKNIEVIPYSRINDGASAGKNLILCYYKDPQVLSQKIPQRVEIFGPQQEATTFKTYVRERHGGVHLYYPIACARAEISKS